jgi:hypothetical protein
VSCRRLREGGWCPTRGVCPPLFTAGCRGASSLSKGLAASHAWAWLLLSQRHREVEALTAPREAPDLAPSPAPRPVGRNGDGHLSDRRAGAALHRPGYR